ncbi:prefoldin subunit [Lentinula edodes]|uniref:Prefoldin subunit n=1 Tax=Lentinula edodes TaxID=5353 RepID=A0A1Q3EHE3_LENED|nr:prefoldin subunit [Lentinula edodes]
MSLSDETLRKSQRAHTLTTQQTSVKERERRILQLTIDEIGAIKEDVNLYKGVGKMFMMVPRKEMEKQLKTQEKELSDDIASLNKKSKYLEKQFNEAQAQLRDIHPQLNFTGKKQCFFSFILFVVHLSSLSNVDSLLFEQIRTVRG